MLSDAVYATVIVQRPGERCTKGSNDPVWDPPPVVRVSRRRVGPLNAAVA